MGETVDRRPPLPGKSGGERPRILLSNVFGDDNRGGAAITAAAIGAVLDAFPGSHLALIPIDDGGPANSFRHTKARFPDVEILEPIVRVAPGALRGIRTVLSSLVLMLRPGRRPVSRTVRELSDADMVVGKGGYIFVDRAGLRGLLALWMTAFPLMLATRLGVPAVVHPTSVGPLREPLSRWLVRWILRRVDLILVRDPYSFSEALALGIGEDRIVLVPDSVFGMAPPSEDECRQAARRVGLESARFAAVTILHGGADSSADQRFRRKLAGLLRDVLSSSLVERIVVVAQVAQSRPLGPNQGPVVAFGGDVPVSREFVRLVGDERVSLVEEDLPPDQLVALYGASMFTIGCRLHSALFSLIGGTPAFAVSMAGRKSIGVYAGLGLTEYVVTYPDFDSPKLLAEISRAVADGEVLRSRIKRSVGCARSEVSAIPQLLRRVLDERSIR